ncbi:DEAD/DEAH box helicase [Phenylobacterium sp.]|uniref:helicase-related protein n=1 Tax=Phenylobacterium sp. TaxID=1871053 RepID=UPI0027251455|nr:DEAD/DEAH box helicase [Phenylobacterium sp.]MDO8800070.1 DEAD/DEAH box helicase [Phenylobacterium sp.]
MQDLAGYHELIARKRIAFEPRGLASVPSLSADLKPHQAHCVDFALRQGCSGLYLDTGLGKTFCALEWGRVVVEHTNRPVLMLAPLAVSKQHEREASRWGIDAVAIREPDEIAGPRIYITNYERLAKFDPSLFAGVITDEGSIIKSFTGATTRALMKAFAETPYRLSCSAAPAPNDHMELGQQAQFLGVMASSDMLARWFFADQANMGKYRIKGPGVTDFWRWVASWARCVSTPSDIGFSDDGYILPPFKVTRHVVQADTSIDPGVGRNGQLHFLRVPDTSATSIHREKRLTADARADKIAAVVAQEPNEPWIVWCDTDYEADALTARIPGATEVRGSMHPDLKEERLTAFATGAVRILITKPSIAGQGLNLQHCARMAFVGLSFSYEQYYQAVRRCWRFGQDREVQVHIACADTEESIWNVVSRKAGDHDVMKAAMTKAMAEAVVHNRGYVTYQPTIKAALPAFIGA